MINAQGELLVFEDFVVDRELPKFQKAVTEEERQTMAMARAFMRSRSDGDEGFGEFSISNNSVVVSGGGQMIIQRTPVRLSRWRRFWNWLSTPPEKKEPPGITILEFFKSVKNSEQELAVVKERADGYEKAMLTAKRTGQKALFEKLKAGLNANRMEAQLVGMGLKKFLSEEDVVRFYKQSKRGLRLDWVKNFTRVIPEELVEKKVRADELGVFDNYAVLHYDPEEKSFAETEAEKAARKDPILFGLMRGRRVLYVVGDWVDEVCDLTLDQIADQIGAEAVQEL